MPEAQIANSVQLLGLLLEFFADDGRWTRGCYDDGNRGHCLVGALLPLSRKHRLPMAPVIALLQHAMPRLGLPIVHFNDTHCGSAAELRSVILKARRLAHDDAERERAAATVKTWLFAQVEKKRAATAADIGETASHSPPNTVPLSNRPQTRNRPIRARDPEPTDEARQAAGRCVAAQNRCSLPSLPNPSDEMICWPVSARRQRAQQRRRPNVCTPTRTRSSASSRNSSSAPRLPPTLWR